MGDHGPPPVEAQPYKGLTGFAPTPGDSFAPINGSLFLITYKFGPWNVIIPWPALWLIRGEAVVPSKNRDGFVPSAEFGVPTFNGETTPRLDLGTVAPFAYPTLGAGLYTPEVPFIFGETLTGMTYRSIAAAVRAGASAEEAVKKFIPSRR